MTVKYHDSFLFMLLWIYCQSAEHAHDSRSSIINVNIQQLYNYLLDLAG